MQTNLCTFNKIRSFTGGYAFHWGATAPLAPIGDMGLDSDIQITINNKL